MSAPPLPEVFGNYALGDFVEIVAPNAISWLPQTTGWLWLGIALLALIARYSWRALKHWYHNRYRREAATRLRLLSQQSNKQNVVGDINRVLKITAVVAYSRASVAKLSGTHWADFLNQRCEQPPFNSHHKQLLATGGYRDTTITAEQEAQLLQASLQWIAQHREFPSV